MNITDTSFVSDEQEFIALMRENQERLFRLAFNLLGDAEEAKDATQETFVRAWKKLDALRRDTSRAWLSKTTVNLCMDWLRKRKFKGDLPEDFQQGLLFREHPENQQTARPPRQFHSQPEAISSMVREKL